MSDQLTFDVALPDDGWCVNSDREGGNAGKPAHRYRLIRERVAA